MADLEVREFLLRFFLGDCGLKSFIGCVRFLM